ncbi:DUF1990 domain-containing protein [Catelliglobosispora koreensis]|uniref:DUF1990 domain-containing protein n=1 Tax=Catelliglobosispora koreensis TaxID=129052 RepID=UPI00036E0BBF|nr:DUF1990 domain-containing protein [Catelliglobosispora koreensis]
MTADVTYAERGASRVEPMPPGYQYLRYETFIGYGGQTMAAATEALLSFEMYREMGLGARLEDDVVYVKLLGITTRCRVLWSEATPAKAGFTYGTMPGHHLHGEETFLLTHEPDDRVWLQVKSFSRPARWYAYALAPVTPLLQREFARRAGRALRRIVDRARV